MVGDLCILPVSNSQKGFFRGKIFPILNESRKIKLDYSLAYFLYIVYNCIRIYDIYDTF